MGVGANFLSQYCMKVEGIEVEDAELKYAHRLNKRDNVGFRKKDFFDMPADEKLSSKNVAYVARCIRRFLNK
jgi:hypothetical protein